MGLQFDIQRNKYYSFGPFSGKKDEKTARKKCLKQLGKNLENGRADRYLVIDGLICSSSLIVLEDGCPLKLEKNLEALLHSDNTYDLGPLLLLARQSL